MKYKDFITQGMTEWCKQEKSLIVGSNISSVDSISGTLKNIHREQKLAVPQDAAFQVDLCTGLAIAGYKPLLILPAYEFYQEALFALCSRLGELQLCANLKICIRVLSRSPGDTEIQPTLVRTINFSEENIGEYTHHIVNTPVLIAKEACFLYEVNIDGYPQG